MASVRDIQWETMLEIARAQQQNWYEMLSDEWTVYEEHDFEYLKLKIAMSMFGLPGENSDPKEMSQKKVRRQNSTDFIQAFDYNALQREMIDKVYDQIVKHGIQHNGVKGLIYYGFIYTVYFREKSDTTAAQGTAKDNTQENEATDPKVYSAPLFKVQKYVKKIKKHTFSKGNGTVGTIQKEYDTTDIWFIDIHSRVYKSWEIYKSNNTLPPCTMVLPQDGFYQPDLACLVTEESSSVAVEVLNSPACELGAKLCEAMDTASTVVSVVGMGIGVASMFTPVGPAVLGIGAVTTAASGIWTVGRSAHNLIDRSQHEESINITDRRALGSWIGIAGSVCGVASSAGTTLLTRSAQAGQNISSAARIASNTATGGCLFFNGAGVLYQGFSIYTKYQETETIDAADVLMFSAHVFFFSNAVMNVKFAGALIESTQGKVIDDFQANIRSKRMRKAFNRTTSNAETKADVVRFVNTKNDILANMKPSANASTGTSQNASTSTPRSANVQTINLKYANGKIKLNDDYLLDPMQFVRDITIQNASYRASAGRSTDACGNVDRTVYDSQVFIRLKNVLAVYVESFVGGVKTVLASQIVQEATDVLKDVLGVHEPEEILCLAIQIAIQLLTASAAPQLFFSTALRFVVKYVKAHLKKRRDDAAGSDGEAMYKILTTIVESMEKIMPMFVPAFKVYLAQTYH